MRQDCFTDFSPPHLGLWKMSFGARGAPWPSPVGDQLEGCVDPHSRLEEPKAGGMSGQRHTVQGWGWKRAGRRVGTLWWTGELAGERSNFPPCSESAQKEAHAHVPRMNSLEVRPSLHPRVGPMPRLLASGVVGGRLLWEAEEGSTLAPSAVHLLPSAALGSTASQGCKLAFRLH